MVFLKVQLYWLTEPDIPVQVNAVQRYKVATNYSTVCLAHEPHPGDVTYYRYCYFFFKLLLFSWWRCTVVLIISQF